MRKGIVALACALLMGGIAADVSATPISVGDSNYLGYVDPGTPAEAGQDIIFINYLMTLAPGTNQTNVDIPPNPPNFLYTVSRSSNAFGPLPLAVLAGGQVDVDASGPLTIDATGYYYLLGKFGNVAHVWVLGGTAGQVELPDQLTGEGSGLSNYSLFNPTSVPEDGTTLALLGLGIVALGLARRFIG